MQNLYSPVQIWSSPLPNRASHPGCAVFLLGLLACSDPPDPPPIPGPPDLPRWSTAPHVRWEGLQQTQQPDHLIALFVDVPGGPYDLLAHNADVATFLNDRFHAVFLTPERAGLAPGVRFVSAGGCLLTGHQQPATPAEWIDAANAAVLQHGGAPWAGVTDDRHPLSGACAGH